MGWLSGLMGVASQTPTLVEGTSGLLLREQFADKDDWTTDEAAAWAVASNILTRSGGANWTCVGTEAGANISFYQDIAAKISARHGFAVQCNLRINGAGNFAGIGMFGANAANSAVYIGWGTVNHMELTRYVAGVAASQDLDATLTGVTATWYTGRMTIKQNGSNIDVRGLGKKGLGSATELTNDLVQYVALSNIAYPTGSDYLGAVSWSDNSWAEFIVFGSPANAGAIKVTGVPTNWKVQVDSRTAVAESGGTVTIPMTTWETWAMPCTTIKLLNAQNNVVATDTPAAGLWGGHNYSVVMV